MNKVPPGQGLKSRDKHVVTVSIIGTIEVVTTIIRAIQFLTAVC